MPLKNEDSIKAWKPDPPDDTRLGTRPSDILHSTAAKRLWPQDFSRVDTKMFDQYLAYTISVFVYSYNATSTRYAYVVFCANEDLETIRQDLRAMWYHENLPTIRVERPRQGSKPSPRSFQLTENMMSSAFRAIHQNPELFQLHLEFLRKSKAENSVKEPADRVH